MTHEERLAYAKNCKCYGFSMIGSGVAVFGGICGGLWNSHGAGKDGVQK